MQFEWGLSGTLHKMFSEDTPQAFCRLSRAYLICLMLSKNLLNEYSSNTGRSKGRQAATTPSDDSTMDQ